MSASDLEVEQAYIDRAYEQLDRMRRRAEELAATTKGGDPDLEWALIRRVRALRQQPRALCFGRIDATDGQTWYVGRRHVEDVDAEPVVVEWRAPVALPFYRAGWSDPMGLTRRRQFVVDGRELLSIGDDFFGADQPDPGDRLRGRDALLVELERARSGEMLDIVATIQPEQDQVIRAPVGGVLAVQGGPGSGKTAVGLHRAAFLLYGDDALARANVLVVGPNRTFLRYIAQVLPSLGEQAVVQTTLIDLVPELTGSRGRRAGSAARSGVGSGTAGSAANVDVPGEAPDLERLKGDERMAQVLARALDARRRASPDDVEVALGLRRLVIPAAEANDALAHIASRRLPYAAGRDVLRDRLVRLLAQRYEDAVGALADAGDLGRQLRQHPGLAKALDARWPSVAAATLVADLLSKPGVLKAAAEGILTADEAIRLRRRQGRAWTRADGPIIDEAKALITGQSRTYGYAIVDEAQDLSPMQLRMLARRCPSGSMTLLGDLAQSVGPWRRNDWRQLGAWLPGGPDAVDVVELRYGYRSPGEVLDLASRLLPAAAPGVRRTQAVRPGRWPTERRRVEPDELLDELAALTQTMSAQHATVAVIVPDRLADDALEILRAAAKGWPGSASPGASSQWGPAGRPGDLVGEATQDGLGRPVTVIRAETAKGLEFDGVVVVEPSGILAERDDPGTGLRLLYVALTRATQQLAILHSDPLPDALAS